MTCPHPISVLAGAGLILVALSPLAASPRQPGAPPTRDYITFKVITDRNIFNATRSRGSAGSNEQRKTASVDTLTLVGTLTYDKGPFAFFEGSTADFKKILEPGKEIAGYKIAEITGTGVKLEAGTNTVELYVGMQMRREENGPWKVVGGSDPRPSVSTGSSAAASADSADDDSEIIKRLMKQREQDLK